MDLGRESGSPIADSGSTGASRVGLARSNDAGALELGVVHLGAGGTLGRQEAVLHQLFLVVAGEGWICGEDGIRLRIRTGEAAHLVAGESHEVGTEAGLTAVALEAERLPLQVGEPQVLTIPELAGAEVSGVL